jgi:hypothetical protein
VVEENPILKQQINVDKQKLELKDQELAIKDQMIALEEKRAELYKQAFESEKELTDRAIKLAGVGKSVFQDILEWVIRIALFAAGVFVAR